MSDLDGQIEKMAVEIEEAIEHSREFLDSLPEFISDDERASSLKKFFGNQ